MIRPALDFLKGDSLPAPVMGLVSGDPLLTLWVRRHLLGLLGMDPTQAEASIDIHTGLEMPHYKILSKIRERPLFGSGRVLWITKADQAPEINPEELLNRNGRTHTTIVLEGSEKTLSNWSKKIPVFHLSPPAKTADREMWIANLAGQYGLTLHKSAIDPIMTTFEGSLGPVDRLFRDIGQSRQENGGKSQQKMAITAEELEHWEVTSHYKTVFELIRGVENGDRKFFREWERFLENGQSPFGLISLLHRQWKLYRIGKSCLSEPGVTPESAEETVALIGGVPPKIAGLIVRTARKLSRESILKGVDALWEADSLLKSGLPSSLVMDRLAATLFTLFPAAGPRSASETDAKRTSSPV